MTESMNLLTAQITFLSSHLVLVHIPIDFLHFFIQPILAILFGRDHNDESSTEAWTDRHDFLNFSITPVGCSLICSKYLIDRYLTPVAEQFNALIGNAKQKPGISNVEISQDEYIVIEVDGQGLEAGQRVLELTAPLAMAGISIFFITTYFSDYILVPCKAKQTVLTTLQQRGFVFSAEAEAYVSQLSPMLNHHNHPFSPDRPASGSSTGSDSRYNSRSAPSTPPAKDVPELQIRTFTKLLKNKIEPIVDKNLRLVSCAGTRGAEQALKDKLKDDLIQVLLASSSPKPIQSVRDLTLDEHDDISATFLSVTLSTEPISILMEERLLPHLGSTLLVSQNDEDILTPIILDLRSLGWQATGIVGGVAGRLSQRHVSYELEENGLEGQDEDMEISFLSTAKAGSVLVQVNKLEAALTAMRLGMEEVRSRI